MNNKKATKEIDYVKDNTNSDLNKIEFFEKLKILFENYGFLKKEN